MRTTNIIRKASIALMLFILTAIYNQTYAQAHNVKCASCKYWQRPADAKNVVNTGCVCEACRAKDEKELKAKQAEDKRRQDVLIAKQKSEAAERERIAKENKAREEAEKKRKEENIARLKQESEAATRRANEIRNRYKELNNLKGEYGEEIKELKAYGDNEYIGVKFNDDILWREPRNNQPIYINRISGTNYFLITDNSKEINNAKIYDMYGKPILVDGYDWIDRVYFDKESDVLEIKIIEEPYYKASSNDLYLGDAGQHETQIYSTKEELLTVHNVIYEKGKAAFRAKYAGTTGGILVSYQTLRVAKGKLIKTDIKIKVLEKKTGYLFHYY